MIKIILASTSPYRAELLRRLKLKFDTIAPGYEESRQTDESPGAMARRLALGKTRSVIASSVTLEKALIIGSDQVAHLGGKVLHKPGNFETASQQLRAANGKWMTFTTAIAVVHPEKKLELVDADEFQIKFRSLSSNQISSYLKREQPYDCAGSIKAEGLGAALFEETRGSDINTLYGLPLILLTDLLTQAGIDVLQLSD